MLKRGFSLMEMMIVLLIVAIIAAASAPMVSKKMANDLGADGSDCGWIALGNDTFFNGFKEKGKKSVIIGAQQVDGATGISKDKPRLYIESDNMKNSHITLDDKNHRQFGKANIALYNASYWFSNQPIDETGASTAMGYNSKATKGSAAYGSGTEATGINSLAIGSTTKASANWSIAIGNNVKGTDNSSNSIAIGNSAQTSGYSSLVIGALGKADADRATAIGYNSTASDYYGIAVGTDTEATARSAIAIGSGSKTGGLGVTVEQPAKVSQQGGIAIGTESQVDGVCAVAIGYNTTASGKYSTAFGANSVSAENSVAIGNLASSKTNSVAVGPNAQVTADYAAVAVGKDSLAGENGATALGNFAQAHSTGSIAIGDLTKVRSGHAIAIGTGVDHQEGATNSISIGYGANAANIDSIAIGKAEAGSQDSIAIGREAKATYTSKEANMESSQVAIGRKAEATAQWAYAIGDGAKASNVSAFAIGDNARALHKHSMAIGYNAEANIAHQITIGDPDATVYIPGNLVVDGFVSLATLEGKTVSIGVAQKNGNKWDFEEIIKEDTGTEGYRSLRVHKSSDRRLKNVGETFKAGLEEIKKLEVFNYVYKKDTTKTPRVGVMAQDLQKIFPNAVMKGDDGFLRIRMEDMFYALVNAVKELDRKIDLLIEKQKEIDALKAEVKSLKKDYANLEKRLEKLEKRK